MASKGKLIRTTLTVEEWERVKAVAHKRHLSASQLVSNLVRQTLLVGSKR